MTAVTHREALTMQPSDMQVPPPADWRGKSVDQQFHNL